MDRPREDRSRRGEAEEVRGGGGGVREQTSSQHSRQSERRIGGQGRRKGGRQD